MMLEVTDLAGKYVFTPNGLQLGEVLDLVMDLRKCELYAMSIGNTNPEIVTDGRPVLVPFRWVNSISDIIVLRYFPSKVRISKKDTTKKKKQRVLKHRVQEDGERVGWRGPRIDRDDDYYGDPDYWRED